MSHQMSDAIRAAYARGEEEETMGPIVRVDEAGQPVGRIADGDYVIFYDIRGEREIELSRTLTDPSFNEFANEHLHVNLTTMIEYDPSLGATVAFPAQAQVQDTLCEVVSKAGLRQAKAAESEKGVHIRYFLSGKREEPFAGEDRFIIESARDVEDFDERPQMSVAEVADATIARLRDPAYDLVITNFANMDVVGHIDDKEAVLQAIAAVDEQVGRVIAAAREQGVAVVFTADHGSVERWYYPDGKVDTGHTDSLVPCVVVGPPVTLRDGGALTDVAPTILELLGLPKPEAMTGESLIVCGGGNPSSTGGAGVLLLIVDGWGCPTDNKGSLLSQVPVPNLDALLRDWPNTKLIASGEAVGMPEGTVGNSEAGHLHIGAARVIPSDRLRIEWAMRDGSYRDNPAFLAAIEGARRDHKPLHLLGIISFYSSHGSVRYLLELLEMCAKHKAEGVYIHGLLGRRGERPESGAAYIQDVEDKCERLGLGQVVSVIGRHWALDREERWERVEKAYRLLVYGDGVKVV
jgi:2,3-bisphosphoglycerate-independent phosphoglycerate mutase